MAVQRRNFVALDAFSKTEEEARVRTSGGGLISLLCVVSAVVLLWREWAQFRAVTTDPMLVIDRDHELPLKLTLDITFPAMPCALLGLDIMDESGNVQLDVLFDQFTKTRVDVNGNMVGGSASEPYKPNSLSGKRAGAKDLQMDADYCGSCYGSKNQENNAELPPEQRICCQTCDDVHDAYLEAGWAFFDGANIEQCESEGYVKRIQEQLHEGCNVKGTALLNRIQGNLHFAPGKPYQQLAAGMPGQGLGHYHDVSLYERNRHMNLNHVINEFRFGEDPQSEIVAQKIQRSAPLEDTVASLENPHYYIFNYYTNVVPTRYEFLGASKPLDTAQYSATYHDRPIMGGRDADHPTTLHGRGGTPGVYFNLEFSPLKIINRERRPQQWSTLLLNWITTIGGILAVGTVTDKVVYKAQRSIGAKKQL
ncbi:retrograde cargo receptor ERV46 KNAG_0D05030 [Huiozyma naganishii CBS 8797]|uniref:Endoplasmic reticulum-Golgi intermediate compartment protein n=1 Tax=Huiozyma naganishii (strain ATCC MYA-139 / BCRC 22969 / CBS 8797 / KCTC 17520 / NBRC 10181 / NCYC 3082 / Yp74L-3) TaxID=1071383 RepID=J7RYJ7_HUIN7|nr:hypothetical protein KNAG_0D05030 [Kazachstania naganishii CBS 8797]CCK70242.1 hypothetical protein KNAG_0D05030 [Kazachstania naganishii CBS 8797]